ncbi:hypothetical protein [uncultured Parvimonas sp.]|mgnify:CR=1 FL=1|uniref:hypothetical protein n=1 Tax=Parvimonas parva TaxID=2769485 RepID=UPI002595DBDB|nr:hypothetical protein [uncultured Parvimonas sp.]
MKKFKKIMLFVLPLLIMFSLVACKASSNSIVGQWKPEGKASGAMKELTDSESLKFLGVKGEVTLVFTKDEKMDIKVGDESLLEKMKSVAALAGEEAKKEAEQMEMKYKVDGENLTINFMGEEVKATFSIKDDKLTIKDEAGETVFTRVK